MESEKKLDLDEYNQILAYIQNYYIPSFNDVKPQASLAIQKSSSFVSKSEALECTKSEALECIKSESLSEDSFEIQYSDVCLEQNLREEISDVKTRPNSAKTVNRSLDDIVNRLEETFSESVLRIIDQKGLSDAAVYKRANIDRKHFSKIRSNRDYRPSKGTVLALCIALELNIDDAKDLLLKAGFALSRSNKADVIVQYFIEKQDYEIMVVNAALYEFGQAIIGG